MKKVVFVILIYVLLYGFLFYLRNLFWEEHFFLPVYHGDITVSFGQMFTSIFFMLVIFRKEISYRTGLWTQLAAFVYFSSFFVFKFLYHTPSFYTNYFFHIKGFLLTERPHIVSVLLSVNCYRCTTYIFKD
jgi:hypothetical protein